MIVLFITLLISITTPANIDSPARGWNSFDCYLSCVNETQVIENAQAVVKYLQKYGYEYIVVDGGWHSGIDEYGRPQPDSKKFPHGFKWLADQIHSMGLKFGIWVGRGITQDALNENTAVYGTHNQIHAKDIVDWHLQCPWDKPYYGLNMSVNGAQQFYDSLYSQFVDWGVDFIKYDCVFSTNFVYENIVGAYNGIEDSGHSFVFSLSPGGGPANVSTAEKIANITNMYRITGDTWDLWDPSQTTYESSVLSHFNITAVFAENHMIDHNGMDSGKSFPDLDMLPLGYISSVWDNSNNCQPHKYTSLKENEQRVLFTLWSISRSPLMYGGVVNKLQNDSFTLNLITNIYCLNVNSNSINNKQVYGLYNTKNNLPQQIIWSATGNKNDFYIAFFNIDSNNDNKTENMTISFESLGIDMYKQCNYIEAWTNNKGVTSNQIVEAIVKPNDTALVYLDSCS